VSCAYVLNGRAQYEAEQQDREAAEARLNAEKEARAKAEARVEVECERARSLEAELEGHKQQLDSNAAANHALELLLAEQKEQLNHLQREREELMSSQDAVKTDADAMRREVHAFMLQQSAQQQEMEHALHAQVESLQLVCVRLSDSMAEAESKADEACLAQAGERSRMMAQVGQLVNELTRMQKTHKTLHAERQRAEDDLASAVEKLDAARAEMEADAMARMNEVALIKDLRLRLEAAGVQLEESQEQLRQERSDAEQQLAQAQESTSALRSRAQSAENKVVEVNQKLQAAAMRIDQLEAAAFEAQQQLDDKGRAHRELQRRYTALEGQAAARETRLRELQAELDEALVDLRAAEERAAVIESELPSSLDRAQTLGKEKDRLARQLELVGERVMELEAACDEKKGRIEKLEAERDLLVQAQTDEVDRLKAEHEEERAVAAAEEEARRAEHSAQLQAVRAEHLAELQRERNGMDAELEAQRASSAIELDSARERFRQELAEALEQERGAEGVRAAALRQSHDLQREEAAVNAAVLTQRIAALAQEKEDLEQKLSAVGSKCSDLQARLLESEEGLKHVQEQLTSERLDWQDRLAQMETQSQARSLHEQQHHTQLGEAEQRAANVAAELAVALQGLSTKEAEVVSLEDKLQRGADERRALQVAVQSVKTQLARREASLQRLLREQKHTRALLPPTTAPARLASSASSVSAKDSAPSSDEEGQQTKAEDEGAECEMCPREHEIRRCAPPF